MEWLVPILDAVFGSLVRSGLMLITGFLIERHLVTQQIADRFVSDGVAHVGIAVPAILAIVWSVWSKVRGRVKLLTALQATPGTTEQQLEAKIENGLGVSVKAGAVLLACVLAAAVSACGPKSYHTAVVANTSIAQAIFTLQDEEIAAHNAQLITDTKHAEYKGIILKLLQAGDDLTVALREWDASKPAPANIGLAVTQVSNLLNDLQAMTPTANKVIAAAQMVLSVLRGTGVLPSDEVLLGVWRGVVFRGTLLADALPAFAHQRVATARPDGASERAKLFDCHLGARGIRRFKFLGGHVLILLPEVA